MEVRLIVLGNGYWIWAMRLDKFEDRGWKSYYFIYQIWITINKVHHLSQAMRSKTSQPSNNSKQKQIIYSTLPAKDSKSKQQTKKKTSVTPTKPTQRTITKNSQHESTKSLSNPTPLHSDDCFKQLDNRLMDLKSKKQKMSVCIDLFNLMQSNNMQLRCLQHNNTLTLYCLTQRKILCVNCTYGNTKHRTHKVTPLRDSSKLIEEDNQLLKGILSSDLKGLQESIKNCQENNHMLQNQLKVALQGLQADYHKRMEELTLRYNREIVNLKNNFSHVLDKSKKLQGGLQQFKFKIWQTLSKIGIGKGSSERDGEIEVTRQIFCSYLSQLTNLDVRRLTRRQIQRLSSKLKN